MISSSRSTIFSPPDHCRTRANACPTSFRLVRTVRSTAFRWTIRAVRLIRPPRLALRPRSTRPFRLRHQKRLRRQRLVKIQALRFWRVFETVRRKRKVEQQANRRNPKMTKQTRTKRRNSCHWHRKPSRSPLFS